MDFRLTDEQRQVEEMVRALARKEFAPRAAQVDEESRYPEENHRRLAELGLLGMLYPASFGGSEAGPVAYTIALRGVAGGGGPGGGGGAAAEISSDARGREGRRGVRPHRAGGRLRRRGAIDVRPGRRRAFRPRRLEGLHHERRARLRLDRPGADAKVVAEDQRLPRGARNAGIQRGKGRGQDGAQGA